MTIIDIDQTPDEQEILRAIRLRMAALQPALAEYDRLAEADKRLTKAKL